jgi:hypothetical protein
MPQIKIEGLGVVEVDENFFKLSKKEQNDFVDQAVIQDAIDGTGRAFMTGMLFNFRDEIVAALSEPSSFIGGIMDEEKGEAYRRELSRQRLLESAFRRQQPAAAIGAEIAGGVVVPGGVLGTAARGGSLLTKMGRAMGAGAGLGAVAGLGAGEDIESRIEKAGETAALGAAIAPVAAATFPVVGKVTAPVARTIGRLGEAAITEPSVRAARMVARRLKEAGVTSDALEALKREPKPMALADISSKGVQSLSRLVAQSGGKGAELAESLNVRQFGDDAVEGAAARIEQDLISAGVPRQTALEAKAGIDVIKGAKSGALYDKSNAFTVTNELREKLRPIFARPSMRNIISDAQDLAEELGEKFSGTTLDSIDMRGLDFVQRRLRTRESSAYTSNDTMMGGAIKATRKEILDILDSANPDFAKARGVYSDAMSRQEALNLGRKFKTLRSEGEIEAAIKDFGPDELHNFRVGMAQSIRDDLEAARGGADFATKIAGNQRQVRQIKEAFPETGIKPLEDALSKESTMAATRQRTLGGSQTFQTTAEAMRAGAEDLTMAERAVSGARTGGITGAAAEAIGPRLRQALTGVGPRTSRELGRLLFATDPAERAAAIGRVQAARGAGRPVGAPLLPAQPPEPSLVSRAMGQTPGVIGRGLLYSTGQTALEPFAGMMSPISSAQAAEPPAPKPESWTEQTTDRLGNPITILYTQGGANAQVIRP